MPTSSLKKALLSFLLSTCLTPAITQAANINISDAAGFLNTGNYQSGNTLLLQNNINVDRLTGQLPTLNGFTLDGQNKTIVAQSQNQGATSRMIFVSGSNNITFKNITFDGFFRMQDGIFKFNNTKDISLENFTINNMVTIDAKRTDPFWGNAIGFMAGSTGSIDNLSVNNVNFETTSSGSNGAEGGVVYIQHAYTGSAASSISHIKNSTFSGNYISAPNTCLRGGIVYAGGTLPEISNTRFYNNTLNAKGINGGITYNSSANALTLENVSHNNNNVISSSNDIKGGLNYNRGQETFGTPETFNTVEFKENTVTAQTGNIHGGVIYNESEGSNTNNVTFNSVEISDNTIEASTGAISGGLISNQGSQSTVSKLSGNFDNNQITAGTNATGGLVYNNGTLSEISSARFYNNTLNAQKVNGGLVYNNGTLPTISNTQFYNNTINAQEVNGGVTYNSSANALTLENVSYNNNNVISSSNDIKGGLNYNRGQETFGTPETFNTVEFKENTVTAQTGNIHGGVIYNEFEGSNTNNVTFNSVEISDNTIEATLGEISGGLISNQGAQSTISKLSGNFDNNQITAGTNATGGLVYNNGTLSEISSARFYNNTLNAQKVNGGLVYNNGTLPTISNTRFDNNTINAQEVNGGVIYNNSSTPLTITNATFSNNTANTVQGGAIYNNNSTLTLINSNFSGNGATTGNSSGGAIYNSGTNAQLNITADGTDSVFQNNSAAHGEAIYSKDGTVTLTANNQNNVTFYDTIEGDNYVLNINGDGSGKTAQVDNLTPDALNQNVGEVQFFADVSGAETLNLNDGGIMHLGKNVTVNVENYNGNGGLLKLDVELDEEARTMQNGVINVTGDVTGNTDVIINSLNPEGFELATNKFLSADNDNQDTASDFRIAAVYGNPYEWKAIKNKQGDIGSQWYMMLTAYYQPEVAAYVGLERAAIEQNRGLVDSVEKGLAFKGNRICTGEGCIEDPLLPRQEAWVHASYENASIKAPSEFDAGIQGLTAGIDLMRDYDQRMGVFASHNIGNYDFNGKGDHPSHYSSDVDIKSYTGGLYYQLKRNNSRALATVFAGTQDIDVDAKSSYTNGSTNAMQYGASAEVAHKFAYRNHLNLEPSLGLYYTALDIDKVQDNMGKTAEFDMLHYLEAELGLKVEYQFCRGTCANYVYVKPSMIKTFANNAKTKITDSLNAKSYDDELLGRMEVGSNFGLTNHFSGYVTGGYTFGDDYNAYDLNIGIRYAF